MWYDSRNSPVVKCRMIGLIFNRDLVEVRMVVSPETWCRISGQFLREGVGSSPYGVRHQE